MILKRCETVRDIDFVLSVRNDPDIRKQCRRQGCLVWSDLVDAPNGGTRETLIAEVNGVPTGYLHLDRLDDTCELSWNVSPFHRGKGFGKEMVRTALPALAAYVVLAEIKPNNIASLLIAESCGFHLVESHDGLQVWKR